MPTGIEIFGTHGMIQITSNYLNYMFESKSTLLVNRVGTVTFFDADNTKILALVLENSSIRASCMRQHDVGSKQTTYTIFTPEQLIVPYMIFGVGHVISSKNYGFEVYRDDGKLVFSSSSYPMNVVAIFNDIAVPINNAPSREVQKVPSGRKYAVVMSSMSAGQFRLHDGPIGQLFLFSSMNYCYHNQVNNSLMIDTVTYMGGTGGLPVNSFINVDMTNALLIDVTGY